MSFEEDYPSLKGKIRIHTCNDGQFTMLTLDEVSDFCLDKAKVKKAFEHIKTELVRDGFKGANQAIHDKWLELGL